VPHARSLALGAPGIVYVSTRRDKRVYAVVDRNRDHKADQVYTIAQNLDVPNGLAYRDGSLYVGQIRGSGGSTRSIVTWPIRPGRS